MFIKNIYNFIDIEFIQPKDYTIIYWAGTIVETRLRLDTIRGEKLSDPLLFFSAMAINKKRNQIFCCANKDNFEVN